MLKKALLLTVLVSTLVLGFISPASAQASPSHLVITVNRTAQVGQYGVVVINDQFQIQNNGTAPVSSLDFGIPRVYRNHLYYAEAKDSSGNTLTLDANVNRTSPFYWMRVHFHANLTQGQRYNFTVASVVAGVLTPVSTGFEFNFTAAPVLKETAAYANVTYISVQGSDFKILPGTPYVKKAIRTLPALNRLYKPWRAYSNDTFFAPYATVTQNVLDLNSAQRDIQLTGSGGLHIQDKYAFHNRGPPINSLTIPLPAGASKVMAYDPVGAMWSSPQNPGPDGQVTVSPRYSLGIRGNESFIFTLSYDLPPGKYLKQEAWWGVYKLSLPILENPPGLVVQDGAARIISPAGSSFTGFRLAPQPAVSSQVKVEGGDRFLFKGVTSYNNLTSTFTVTYLPFWSAIGYIPWIVGFEVIMVGLGVALYLRRGKEIPIPIPVERLREFVKLYDERLTLSRELVIMEKELGRGSMGRHEFRRRRRAIDTRLDDLRKSIREVKSELSSMSERYADLIRRIDRAEAEIDASRATMRQVRDQYRVGKTTRAAYETVTADISRRIDRSEGTLETILITLREEAR